MTTKYTIDHIKEDGTVSVLKQRFIDDGGKEVQVGQNERIGIKRGDFEKAERVLPADSNAYAMLIALWASIGLTKGA